MAGSISKIKLLKILRDNPNLNVAEIRNELYPSMKVTTSKISIYTEQTARHLVELERHGYIRRSLPGKYCLRDCLALVDYIENEV